MIDAEFSPLADCVEAVPLVQAIGRVLAEDVVTTEYVPDFNRSTVDGYALRARDTFGCSDAIPAILPLAGEELMGEEAFEKFGMQTDTTHISITDSELEQELGVIYDPVCIAVPYSAPNQENAVKWIKALTAGNKL